MVVRKLAEMSAEIKVHDPYVEHWYELEEQDTYRRRQFMEEVFP